MQVDDRLTWSHGLDGFRALHELAPHAAAALDRLSGALSAPEPCIDTVRRSRASALELPALASGRARPAREDPTRAWLDSFATQFSIDVSALSDEDRDRLCEATGQSLRSARGRIIAMTWVADFVPRVRVCLDRLFRSSEWPTVPEQQAGVTEADLAAIDDFQHSELSSAQKAALGLVDAIIWTPARIEESVVTVVRAQFTPTQAVEIVLDVMRNAWNKTTVAAALDEAHVTDGTEVYEYMDDGTVQYGLCYR